MNGLNGFLSSAPVLLTALLVFTAVLLIGFNLFNPDLLFYTLD